MILNVSLKIATRIQYYLLILMVLWLSLEAIQQLGGQFRLFLRRHSRESQRYVNYGKIMQKRNVRSEILVE